jgi:CheY-like chemotaxis protein
MILYMEAKRQFRRRVLLVDSNHRFLQQCSRILRTHGFEVLVANDGFAALLALQGGHPDVMVAELELTRMSGFELLSIVRTRFPQIAVIAISGEYTPVTVPDQAICDAFIAKGANFDFELLQEAERLIRESPLRSTRAKSDIAPVWIPHSGSGYIVLTCPECLRSFSALEVKPGRAEENCVCCGAKVPFEMSPTEVQPTPPPSAEFKSRLTPDNPGKIAATSRRKSQCS